MARTLMGVVHLQPCPSSARGSASRFEETFAAALVDARALADGGCDGLIVENFGDAPFHRGTVDDPVPPDVPAALAVVARAAREATGLPVGINCLRNDGVAAIGAAVVAGAAWVRINVLTGAMVTDQGLIAGEAARVAAYAKRCAFAGAILADLAVKHAAPLAAFDLGAAAQDLAERSGAGALVLSGTRTGEPVDPQRLDAVRAAVGDFPILLGSGLTEANAAALWPRCDGAIVGTAVKRDGRVTAPVDPHRVAALRRAVDAAAT